MNRHYTVHLANDEGERTTLRYRLLNHRATELWLGIFDETDYVPSNPTLAFSSDLDIGPINRYIDRFNRSIGHKRREPIPRFGLRSLGQDLKLLNRIHSLFEQYHHALLGKGWLAARLVHRRAIFRLERINESVHGLESKLPGYYGGNDHVSASLSVPSGRQHIPLPDEVKPLFQASASFGDLFLNYATTGKSLLQIWQSGDIDLLRNGGSATPQQFISRGVLSLFSGDRDAPWSECPGPGEAEVVAEFERWFDRHDLAQYGYRKGCVDNCLGYIKIGEFVPRPEHAEASCGEIVDYYARFPEVRKVELS